MKIGNLDLGEKPVLLAPMEDVTDASFRAVCKECGADMVYTEFVPSDGLIRDAARAIAKMRTSAEEAPIGIQIYGHIPESMVEAAQMADRADEIAGGHGCEVIDINFGCPVSKIAGRGAGSGMMREPDKMIAITKAVVEAVRKPVTVKTRLGWDEHSKIIVELAERLQDCGIAALTIHGRTRQQMYKGSADWSLIAAVRENPRIRIPVIGNGDITTPERAAECFSRYGVDGIMVGRASFGNPWIFKEIKHFLRTGERLAPAGVPERVALAKRHLGLSLALKGEVRGVFEMRRHLSCYFKGLPDFKETRIRLVTERDPQELYRLLDGIAARWGDFVPARDENVYGV
jgi:nifR3 family TIM-barrel protein